MNCSFNIRYKPRTTRAFTKSDLTVYDSAGNTALNALTVYGKSEVVDGAIVSAGEGWRTVDLGILTWTYIEVSGLTPRFRTYALSSLIKAPINNDRVVNAICSKYQAYSGTNLKPAQSSITQGFAVESDGALYIKDTDYTDATAFKNSLNGVMLAYQLADPTQGNCIAVKTDDGTGINGTMATFSTGTPLRGIPESNVRDVMVWNGSTGTVAKVCAKVKLADLTWIYYSPKNVFVSTTNLGLPIKLGGYKGVCSDYNVVDVGDLPNMSITISNSLFSEQPRIGLKNTNYTTVEAFVASLRDAELVYELASPTTEQLTTAENTSIAGLRMFEPQTHAQNNAQTDMTVDYTIRVPTI